MACVYILTNETIPGLLKIGFTGGTAADRAGDISRGTGVPSPYAVHWFLETTTTEAARAVEQSAHQSLATDRHNRAREFFTTSLAVAIDTIERIAYQHGAIANDLTVIARLLEEERAAAQSAQLEAAAAAAERSQHEAAAAAERAYVESVNRAFVAAKRAEAPFLLVKLDELLLSRKYRLSWLLSNKTWDTEFRFKYRDSYPYTMPYFDEQVSEYRARLEALAT